MKIVLKTLLTAKAGSELEILRLNRDTFGMNGTKIGLREELRKI